MPENFLTQIHTNMKEIVKAISNTHIRKAVSEDIASILSICYSGNVATKVMPLESQGLSS
jgi:hypothetical protein